MRYSRRFLFLGPFFILFGLTFLSCQDLLQKRYGLHVVNNSNSEIICIAGMNGYYDSFYPDTLLPFAPRIRSIKPGQSSVWHSAIPWDEHYFKQLPADTLSFFIISKDVYDRLSWDKIRTNYLILNRYDLSSEDVAKLGNRIPYPATEAMRDMKMYSSFSEGNE